ncbi:MAG: 2OG-Fe(II) oxygenase [Halioglobus sp.]
MRRRSASGDASSKAQLGLAYLTASGVPGNPDLGIKLVDEAAAAGDPQGAALAATIRATSLWRERDWPSALDYLAKAAEAGHRPSQSALQIVAAGPEAIPAKSEAWQLLRAGIDLQEWLAPAPFELLCESPPIRSIDKFISVAACNWLVDQVRGRLQRSTIYDKRTGGSVVDERRINSQSDLGLENMGLLTFLIRARIAVLLNRSDEAMEIPKVLHYASGETFAPHYDYLTPDEPAYAQELAQRGQRAETFLIYLNDDYDGGETSFTDLGWMHRGAKGGALWFDNLDVAGEPDPNTRHAGLPPSNGEKWLFSQWVRDR